MDYRYVKAYRNPVELGKLVAAILHEMDDDESDKIELVHIKESVEEREIPVWQLKELSAACDKWLLDRGIGVFGLKEQIIVGRLVGMYKKRKQEKEL